MMTESNLTTKSYWQDLMWHKTNMKEEPESFDYSLYSHYFHRFLTPDPTKSCIEIGGYPGTHLGYLAKHFRFRPTAIDFVDNIDRVGTNMRHNGITDCELINEDFCCWQPTTHYDVVCSFGFLEHFENYEEIYCKHLEILAPGGLVFVGIPCKSIGFYYHTWKVAADYASAVKGHNLSMMNFKSFRNMVDKYADGMEILYFGNVWERSGRSMTQFPLNIPSAIVRFAKSVLGPIVFLAARKV